MGVVDAHLFCLHTTGDTLPLSHITVKLISKISFKNSLKMNKMTFYNSDGRSSCPSMVLKDYM